ncbi:O-acetylhomoserine/O-acetylserine sulfhydrylase [Corynebacterium diphtheriae bv. mitis]|uniref:O-acetylhomoserine/O-acetylserine sulfhydrylase n=1 Tax=Corynebacterium diphtheriae TaxID=1717 RepID=UPI000245A978|nr:O-acetylhomoserine/O-acetylserine sulfhydrylase [Corynebacterium diphtheriae]AEX41311.1 O-acetylhomoserineaminocarboxypropyltransferase [Corynebacterium diphtheriae 31A]AEX45850.1 O-acetylhomoserineaminocarboxypropyltransferase [Corynebacterium diphtheriae INCA 402]AEX69286.1 O-acetylhomoserineaminocarboxypropyltransferase [Corynebacterium diphtheriae PW8]AEX71576.1 O-acetylhomoserineaminocarboxypropyltransferase [Corynebacterium diphtheriae CDCE 8392]MBG9302892.1 O-acetylhomoserine/O-acety
MPTKYDNSNANKWGFETRSIHAGQSVDSDTGARNLPIYLTSSYVFNDAEHAANRFNLSDAGPVYSRLTNPTVAAVEERLANLEGGVHAVLFASGMAAETAAILNIARAGSHIVSSPRIYGGTETLFAVTLARLGIETTFVENPDDPASWEAAVQDNTVALYGETFANPQADVLDIPAIAEVAHKHQVPLIVDNTLATAALVRPLELGADVVVASLTKFYTGNGSGLGGVLIDGGNFDWTVTRNGEPIFPDFVTPDPAYHGLKYSDLGAPAFGLKARVGLLRDTGAAPSPLNAWITAQGLDTLSLRVQRHNENALAVAQFLANHDKVAKVNYAGLPDSPWYPVKEKLGFDYTGSVLSFDVKGGKDEAWRFIDALKLHSNLANVGDVRSLVVHPATTTHSQSEESALLAAGINQATIRLSVGIESIDDIISDLTAGFDAI